MSVLAIEDLTVSYANSSSLAVEEANLSIGEGEVLGLVGESGSGKSTLALAIARLLPTDAVVSAKQLRVSGEDILSASPAELRSMRSRLIGYVFQAPITSLDPTMRVGRQLALCMPEAGRADVHDALLTVHVPDTAGVARRFPHQLSGGLAQRVAIAMAIARRPRLLIVDEPTSALDASLTGEILEMLLEQRRRHRTSILLVSHDLGAIAAYADRVAVMQGGRIVESGTRDDVFNTPKHEYTRHLLKFHQAAHAKSARVEESASIVASLESVNYSYPSSWGNTGEPVLHGIDLEIRKGEVLGLIGESGSGKTTIARLLLGLARPTRGSASIDGIPATSAAPGTIAAVLQNPDWALNPRLKIGASIVEPLIGRRLSQGERVEKVEQALSEVGLAPEFRHRYPGEMSGGQRQRASIARALITEPRFIVFDEPVSALDAAIQHQIIEQLAELRRRTELTAMFISHDLQVTRRVTDRIAVLYDGRVVEIAPSATFYASPLHPYSRLLLAASMGVRLRGAPALEGAHDKGCRYAPSCEFAEVGCLEMQPVLRQLRGGTVACRRAEIFFDQPIVLNRKNEANDRSAMATDGA